MIPRNLKIRFKYYSALLPVRTTIAKKHHSHKGSFAQSLRRGLPKDETPRNPARYPKIIVKDGQNY
jgi:hypothetical protein